MLENYWLYLAVLAVIIVVSLAIYAFKLMKQLQRQNKKQQKAEVEHKQALKMHDKKILDSVVIIVRAMKEEQCDISEGCWRLCVLLDSLKTSKDLNLQFPAIFELYGAIKHMPILDARKELDKKARMQLDFERLKIEAELQPAVHENLHLLHNYANERISAISS